MDEYFKISRKYSPDKTAKVMAKIYSDDIEISKLVKSTKSSSMKVLIAGRMNF